MSQFGANFEIKFLIVYWDWWLTLMFQKEGCFPKNRHLENLFFHFEHKYHDIGPTFTSSVFSGHMAYFRNCRQNLPSTGNAGAETMSHVITATHNTSHGRT